MACGDVYEGGFKDDLRNGFGTMRYTEGGVYTGQWLNRERHGAGKMVYPNGDVFEGEWIGDAPCPGVMDEASVPGDAW